MNTTTVEGFYQELASQAPQNLEKEIGHFDIFDLAELFARSGGVPQMPYNRRTYYKISLIKGRNRAEYADKVVEIDKAALLFATPRIPYHWLPYDQHQSGHFCIFTHDFLVQSHSRLKLDDLPIFQPGGQPIFQLDGNTEEIEFIFQKMHREIHSEYPYKFDLLRNYVLELIHFGQKLQPVESLNPVHSASARVSALFTELLERQFPIEAPHQRLKLRSAKDFAENLGVHVNHLNKMLKQKTGKTTSEIIAKRVVQEAKILLKQTDWNVSEIGYCLGFEEIAHFSNFFKKKTSLSPQSFRS